MDLFYKASILILKNLIKKKAKIFKMKSYSYFKKNIDKAKFR